MGKTGLWRGAGGFHGAGGTIWNRLAWRGKGADSRRSSFSCADTGHRPSREDHLRADVSSGPGFGTDLLRRLRWARDIYEGIYLVPYRTTIHREYLRQRDLFFLLGFSDLLGVPSPVHFYTLELLPEVLDQFHEWHLRMGMDEPPEGGFRCC